MSHRAREGSRERGPRKQEAGALLPANTGPAPRLEQLHPRPWMLSFLGAHMERVVGSTEELLALGPKGIDPQLTAPEFFRLGHELWRSRLEAGTMERPYSIHQEVFPYTPPKQDPRGAGEDLARVLEAAEKPVLLTGRSGAGKTLLTRELYWRILFSEDSEDSRLRDWLFVQVAGSSLRGLIKHGEPLPGPGIYTARAVRGALIDRKDTAASPFKDVEDAVVLRWLEKSPPILIVIDLNRADTDEASKLLHDILESPWKGKHRFLILYRTQSALLDGDRVWERLDPERGETVGVELRNIDLETARGYFRAARRRFWRGGFGAKLAEEPLADDLHALEALAREHGDFIGIPLLLHLAASLDGRLAEVENLASLYRRVLEGRLERERLADGRELSPADRTVVKRLTSAVSLEFAARALDKRGAPVGVGTAPAQGGGQEQQTQGLHLAREEHERDWKWTDPDFLNSTQQLGGAWAEHFKESLGAGEGSLLPREPEASARDRLLIAHSVFTSKDDGLAYIHDSFAYYYSAHVLRYPKALEKPGPHGVDPETKAGPEFLGRIATILKEDPVFWHPRVEFLGGMLPEKALHWLVFAGILADPRLEDPVRAGSQEELDQLKLIFLASQLARGLSSLLKAGRPVVNDLRRLLALFPSPGKLHTTVDELLEGWQRRVSQTSKDFDPPIFAVSPPTAPQARPPCSYLSLDAALSQPQVQAKYADLRRLRPRVERLLKSRDKLMLLGVDPESSLLEFADLRTGAAPVRAVNGQWVIAANTAAVFVLLPGGSSCLGSPAPEAYRDDETAHESEIHPFLIGKHLVTQGQWGRLVQAGHNAPASIVERLQDGLDGSERDALIDAASQLCRVTPRFTGNPRLPMEQVNWYQGLIALAALYLRFPTEEEWEYACRGGANDPTAFHGTQRLGDLGWFLGNSKMRPHPVGEKAPNAYGLHDMHGSLWEWCQDRYEEKFGTWSWYQKADSCAPRSPNRVLRGGSYWAIARACRMTHRHKESPFRCSDAIGLRAAMTLP